MATSDVPGANPSNGDSLGVGCWAEHDDDESLVFVEGTEDNRVIYSMFDMDKSPPIEYRDSMATATFEKTFGRGGVAGMWTWHDKTPFPWQRVIDAGMSDGPRAAFADHQTTAADKVADSLHLRGARVGSDLGHRLETVVKRQGGIWDKLSRAIAELGK